MLLDRDIWYSIDGGGRPTAWTESSEKLPTRDDYGYLWTCLGEAPSDLFHDPAVDETDRRSATGLLSERLASTLASEISPNAVRIYQPKASAASNTGMMVDYTFKVVHPTCAFLYKSSPLDEARLDVVGLFCQPVRSDFVRAHLWDARLDEHNTDTEVRRFGQTILAQDKPVLENQLPKELPLGGEVPVRSDKTGAAYRRWLYDMGWTYGVIRD